MGSQLVVVFTLTMLQRSEDQNAKNMSIMPHYTIHHGNTQIFLCGLASYLHENPVFITENDYF